MKYINFNIIKNIKKNKQKKEQKTNVLKKIRGGGRVQDRAALLPSVLIKRFFDIDC